MNISNVVNITQEVKKLSVSSHPLQARDISNIATILQKIVAVKQKANEVGYILSKITHLESKFTNFFEYKKN